MKWDWRDFLAGQLLFSAVCGLPVFVVVMAAEGLHYVSNGRVPALIEWQPKQKASVILDDDDDREDEDDSSSLPEWARPPFYVTP